MRFAILAATLLAGTAYSSSAQQAAPAPSAAPLSADSVITPEGVRAHVAFLADDLLEGRDAGTRGYDLAARYVATRFDALGLKPGADGGWYQQITFAKSRFAPDKPALLAIGGASFANGGADVAFVPDGRFPDQRLEAGAVFVGHGIDSPADGFTDYAGLDVRGKFVVMLYGVPAGTPSEVGADLSASKEKMAEARGAIGIVYLVTPAMQKRYPWAMITQSVSSSPRAVPLEPDGKPRTETPGLQATIALNSTGAGAAALFAGAPRGLPAIFKEASRPKRRIKGFALAPALRLTQSSVIETMKSPNVVAVLPGSDPALAGEYVLVTAHLDHNGVDPDPKKVGDRIYNGAMDNAAGVATMLEAARAFVASGRRPRRSVMFAAVTSEEDGLLGSDYLARHPLTGAGRVVANVNLDMPVLLYDLKDVIAFGAEHSTVGESVARAAAGVGLAVTPDPMPEQNIFVRSDHYSFVKAGVPSVMLATGFQGGGDKAFPGFLATHYHKPSDQIDLPLNWTSAARFAEVNYRIARDLADAPAAPRWYAGDVFGTKFAAGQPTAPKPK